MTEGATAGASAQAEYNKRLTSHKQRARRRRPYLLTFAALAGVGGLALISLPQVFGPYGVMIGWLVLALGIGSFFAAFTTPSHVTAWATGAEGEVRTAQLLAPLESDGFRVLHDRRIPGSRANIDHIVIGPSGVWVVETKSYGGRLRVRGRDIYVQGRRKTGWVDEVRREAAAVQAALDSELAELGLSVSPIICVHRAELPWFGSIVDGIPIVSGRGLVRKLRKTKPVLPPERVKVLADLADARLKSALRAAPVAHDPIMAAH